MFKSSRRQFLIGCSAAIASMSGSRIRFTAFADPENSTDDHMLVVIFLRGGCDALNMVIPLGDEDRLYYEVKRPRLKIPEPVVSQLGNSEFGLHPSLYPLDGLYQDGHLSIIQAVGLKNVNTRSHFDAMAYMEQGTNSQETGTTGWLTRYLESAGLSLNDSFEALSTGYISPEMIHGYDRTLTIQNIDRFNIELGPWGYHDSNLSTLAALYNRSESAVHIAGQQAVSAINYVAEKFPDDNFSYTPANGATYPENEFGNQLKQVAQMIKLQLGLKVATVDLGGWDTHEDQAYSSDATDGYFADLLRTLSQGLNAFYTDLDSGGVDNPVNKVAVVAMSEFGRRLRENENRGTDHGNGGLMFVMGGQVKGGLHGVWPGLHSDQLFEGADLAVNTDYRQVLSELMIRHMGNRNIKTIFPGYTNYEPLDMVEGEDLTPIIDIEDPQDVYLPFMPEE
ncbi:MAG: DUF1501 domain-containing protein [Chloroflexota bacterium]